MADYCTCRRDSEEPCSYCDYSDLYCPDCEHERGDCPDDCYCSECNDNVEEEE